MVSPLVPLGGAAIAVGILDPNPKRGVALMVGGAAAALFGLARAGDEAIAAVESKATEGGALGLGARAIVGNPDPGAVVSDVGMANVVLGPPKNILRVVGKILAPREGGEARRLLFAGTYPAKTVIRNDGEEPVTGRVELVADEVERIGPIGATDRSFTIGGDVTLQPGVAVEQSWQVKVADAITLLDPRTTLRLRFSGFTLDRVTFTLRT